MIGLGVAGRDVTSSLYVLRGFARTSSPPSIASAMAQCMAMPRAMTRLVQHHPVGVQGAAGAEVAALGRGAEEGHGAGRLLQH